jgi:hypothetical protein
MAVECLAEVVREMVGGGNDVRAGLRDTAKS